MNKKQSIVCWIAIVIFFLLYLDRVSLGQVDYTIFIDWFVLFVITIWFVWLLKIPK